MNDLIDGATHTGEVLLDGKDIYARSCRRRELRRRVGMVFQKSNPFPKSVFENVAYGPRVAGHRSPAVLDEIVERSLRRTALWDEVQGPAARPGHWIYRAASSSGCASRGAGHRSRKCC